MGGEFASQVVLLRIYITLGSVLRITLGSTGLGGPYTELGDPTGCSSIEVPYPVFTVLNSSILAKMNLHDVLNTDFWLIDFWSSSGALPLIKFKVLVTD